MRTTRWVRRLLLGAAATVLVVTVAPLSASAAGSGGSPGTRSLGQVLTRDTSGFDRNPYDFDILTRAVLAVIDAKPNSPVRVLTDGSVRLTAFIPYDAAFQRLVADITGSGQRPTERAAFTAVAGLGIDTVENVLLYHVVPGATIDARTALRSDGAALTTALGPTIEVDVRSRWFWFGRIRLIDADTSDRDPRVTFYNINKGNRQIAHAIDRVLRPVDLP